MSPTGKKDVNPVHDAHIADIIHHLMKGHWTKCASAILKVGSVTRNAIFQELSVMLRNEVRLVDSISDPSLLSRPVFSMQ